MDKYQQFRHFILHNSDSIDLAFQMIDCVTVTDHSRSIQ